MSRYCGVGINAHIKENGTTSPWKQHVEPWKEWITELGLDLRSENKTSDSATVSEPAVAPDVKLQDASSEAKSQVASGAPSAVKAEVVASVAVDPK